MSSDRLRVALVDDLPVVREGFSVLHPQVEVVAAFATVEEMVEAFGEIPGVDLVVLDLHLRTSVGDQIQGLAAVRVAASLGVPVCLYTGEERRLVVARCLQQGANGVVHKQDAPEEAAQAFQVVAAGGTHLSASVVGLAEVLERQGDLPDLTERQREVLSGRARGESWRIIARRLDISEGVAREHMSAVAGKFAEHLRDTSPADLERALGLSPGDLLAP
ncbi:response regulator [Kytococcus sedentarius]|uniref:response regulator n=1 Tax=Kytococcus sedentarius TaxID=1276 RepID=UPI0035BC95B2